MVRRIAVALCALVFAAGSAQAQQHATLTLRSGDKVAGDLVDLGGVGYTVVVNGIEKQVALNEVAIIDFSGEPMTESDWRKFRGPTIVMLRNGDVFNGSLYDISGTSPLRLTVKTAEGERQMASTEVARIVIARPEATVDQPVGTTGTTAALPFPTRKKPRGRGGL